MTAVSVVVTLAPQIELTYELSTGLNEQEVEPFLIIDYTTSSSCSNSRSKDKWALSPLEFTMDQHC